MAEAPENKLKIIIAGAIGNVLEWYDFALFGYFAPVLGRQFFPSEDHVAALLQTYGVFALGFFMRPLGGVLFGHIGDRFGRKAALRSSVLLMAIPTTLVGALPTYHHVGIAATLLLTLIRMLQGISVGGELIGSYSFLGEQAAEGRRGFIGSWSSVSAGGGVLLGSGVAALFTGLLPSEQFESWGWRVPFLGGIFVGLIGLWLRGGVPESASFEQAREKGEVSQQPVVEALRNNAGAIGATFFLAFPLGVGFYIPFVWLSTWLTSIHRPAVPHALTANTIALAVGIALMPLGGALSDRLGRKQVFLAGTAGYALLTYPIFLLLAPGTFAAALQGQLLFSLCLALTAGCSPALFVELFPTRTRYSGIAVGYNLAQALVGGTSPLVATWLISVTGNLVSPAFYLIGCMIVTFLVALRIENRHDRPLQ